MLSDPVGVSSFLAIYRKPTFAFQVFDLVGLRTLLRGSIASLALRPDFALSTLSLRRYLCKPKTRFQVERLHSFPELESHQLEVPGLARRTKQPFNVKV